jgi:hypothetical protein
MTKLDISCYHCGTSIQRVPSQIAAYRTHFCSIKCHGLYRGANLKERLMKSVTKQPNGGCWEWRGTVLTSGYGQIRQNNEPITTHRASWIVHRGPIPSTMFVLHKCDVRHCINPDHLFLGTQSDNMRDRTNKGRDGVKYGTGHWNSRLRPQDIKKIRELSASGLHNGKQLAAMYAVHPVTISNILLGKTWKHVT